MEPSAKYITTGRGALVGCGGAQVQRDRRRLERQDGGEEVHRGPIQEGGHWGLQHDEAHDGRCGAVPPPTSSAPTCQVVHCGQLRFRNCPAAGVGRTRRPSFASCAGDKCDARGRLTVRRGRGTFQPEARHRLRQRGGLGRLAHLPSAVPEELVGAAGVLRMVLHRVGHSAAPSVVCRARIHRAPPV